MPNLKLTSQTYNLAKNQKAFRIHKKREPENNADVRISDIFKNDIMFACRDLKETTFKVYMYLISNQEQFIGGLSCSDVLAQTGISDSSYKRAIKELTDKHYLVYSQQFIEDIDGNTAPLYEFYAQPHLGSN